MRKGNLVVEIYLGWALFEILSTGKLMGSRLSLRRIKTTRAILYGLQVLVSLIIMLFFMTYNVCFGFIYVFIILGFFMSSLSLGLDNALSRIWGIFGILFNSRKSWAEHKRDGLSLKGNRSLFNRVFVII